MGSGSCTAERGQDFGICTGKPSTAAARRSGSPPVQSLDRQRFLRLQPPPEEPAMIAVVINWFDELKKLVPVSQK